MRSAEARAAADGGMVRAVEAATYSFADDGAIPNNPTLPLLVYPGALDLSADDPAATCEAVFAANGWGECWRNGIYPFPHYHSTAHEVLGICCGEAKVRFGGGTGIVLTVRAGDVVVIPAGVGHQNLGASPDLLVVGAYPRGQRFDLAAAGRRSGLRRSRTSSTSRYLRRIPCRAPAALSSSTGGAAMIRSEPIRAGGRPQIESWLRCD
jgi:uncharacterized protein YjlB